MYYKDFSIKFKPVNMTLKMRQDTYNKMNFNKKKLINTWSWYAKHFELDPVPTKDEIKVFESMTKKELTVLCGIIGCILEGKTACEFGIKI